METRVDRHGEAEAQTNIGDCERDQVQVEDSTFSAGENSVNKKKFYRKHSTANNDALSGFVAQLR